MKKTFIYGVMLIGTNSLKELFRGDKAACKAYKTTCKTYKGKIGIMVVDTK